MAIVIALIISLDYRLYRIRAQTIMDPIEVKYSLVCAVERLNE